MRKIFSILVLCSLVIYMGGYHLVYALYREGIKKEMRTWLSIHEEANAGTVLRFALVQNKITDHSFEWEEVDKEFIYKGAMYDVLKVHYTRDSVQICAVKDGKENELNKQLAAIHQNKKEKDAAATSLLKFFSVFTLPDELVSFKYFVLFSTNTDSFTQSICFYLSEVHTPPPRC